MQFDNILQTWHNTEKSRKIADKKFAPMTKVFLGPRDKIAGKKPPN